jgi:hypothetical protein
MGKGGDVMLGTIVLVTKSKNSWRVAMAGAVAQSALIRVPAKTNVHNGQETDEGENAKKRDRERSNAETDSQKRCEQVVTTVRAVTESGASCWQWRQR